MSNDSSVRNVTSRSQSASEMSQPSDEINRELKYAILCNIVQYYVINLGASFVLATKHNQYTVKVNGRRRGNREESSCVSTRFSLSVENEQAGAGQDGRTRLARPNSQARTRTGKY